MNMMKDLDTTLYTFFGSNNPDKVSRKIIIGDYHEGGLRMIHIPSMIKGLKVAWIKYFWMIIIEVNGNVSMNMNLSFWVEISSGIAI